MVLKKIIRGFCCLCLTAVVSTESAFAMPALEQLISDIEAARQTLGIPAIGLTLVDKDRILRSGTFGIAHRASNTPATDETVFRIGSITKTFTALAVLLLVDEGKLALDDKLHDIAPELAIKNAWRQTHPVRLAHLLEHTAGLNDLTQQEFDFDEPLTLAEALRRGPARVVQWPPGRHHSYTNVGPGLLSYAIEKRAGRTYEDFVRERLFEPLGMTSAGFYPDEQTMSHLATGYDSDGKTPIPYWHMTFRAFGAISLRPADMAPFLQLLLNKGRHGDRTLLPPALIERMETPATTLAAASGLRFGYGLGLYSSLRNGHVFYGHGGDGDGYLARYGYNREAGLAYFVVINVFRGSDLLKIRHLIEDFIIRDLPPPAPAAISLTAEEMKELAGTYKAVTWRFPADSTATGIRQRFRIALEQDKLILKKQNDRPQTLVPVTRRHFRFEDEAVATMAFVRDEEGSLYLQGEFGNYRRTGD